MIVLVHNEQTQKSLDVAKCGFDTNENEPCKVEELVPDIRFVPQRWRDVSSTWSRSAVPIAVRRTTITRA